MLRTTFRTRVLVPMFVGSLLTAGCQMTGPGGRSAAIPLTADRYAAGNTKPQGDGNKTPEKSLPEFNGGTPPGTTRPEEPRPFKLEEAPPPRNDLMPANNPQAGIEPVSKEAHVDYVPSTAAQPGGASPYAGVRTPPSGTDGKPQARPALLTARDQQPSPSAEMALKFTRPAGDAKSIEERIQQLERDMAQRDQAVRQSGAEMQAAAEEIKRARKEIEDSRAAVQVRDRAEKENLKALIQQLERMTAEETK